MVDRPTARIILLGGMGELTESGGAPHILLAHGEALQAEGEHGQLN